LVKPDRKKVTMAWKLALDAIVPLLAASPKVLESDAYEIVRSEPEIKVVAQQVAGIMTSLKAGMNAGLTPIRDALVP
jgi:hypothetical protein